MDETQELEGFRLPLTAPSPVLRGVPPKLQQTRFVRVQRQAKLTQPLPQGFQKLLGIRSVLEPNDEVVRKRTIISPVLLSFATVAHRSNT